MGIGERARFFVCSSRNPRSIMGVVTYTSNQLGAQEQPLLHGKFKADLLEALVPKEMTEVPKGFW